ncbi:hypothetical protein ACS5NO_06940 [Larkinella sp. GY13]|uniref:hypothetical protein n=1 Tax=Larkinella sp. GY13 TaxID=3453720 RepID=UPI003EED0E64
MVRIIKSDAVPARLAIKGVLETTKNCQLYETNPAVYDNGTDTFEIDSDIYGDASVKEQLIAEQNGKCCFCEADFTANGYGDVEHFRPKAGYTITLSGKLNRPGYYWLGYDWKNLYFSCQICNQRHKKNYFPLEDEAKRAKNHLQDYRLESVALIHPSDDEAENHIHFNRHIIIHKTQKGKNSIRGYGIYRVKLNAAREAHLQNVRNNVFLARVDLDTITEPVKAQFSQSFNLAWEEIELLIKIAKLFVNVAAKSGSPFALMVRNNFPELPVI